MSKSKWFTITTADAGSEAYCGEYVQQLERQRDDLLAALIPLYEHCKNNLQICGKVEAARAAIEKATGGKA